MNSTYIMMIGLLLMAGCTLPPTRPSVYTAVPSAPLNLCDEEYDDCLSKTKPQQTAIRIAGVPFSPGWDSKCNEALKRCYQQAQTLPSK